MIRRRLRLRQRGGLQLHVDVFHGHGLRRGLRRGLRSGLRLRLGRRLWRLSLRLGRWEPLLHVFSRILLGPLELHLPLPLLERAFPCLELIVLLCRRPFLLLPAQSAQAYVSENSDTDLQRHC